MRALISRCSSARSAFARRRSAARASRFALMLEARSADFPFPICRARRIVFGPWREVKAELHRVPAFLFAQTQVRIVLVRWTPDARFSECCTFSRVAGFAEPREVIRFAVFLKAVQVIYREVLF